jgi:predicted methyltransferase
MKSIGMVMLLAAGCGGAQGSPAAPTSPAPEVASTAASSPSAAASSGTAVGAASAAPSPGTPPATSSSTATSTPTHVASVDVPPAIRAIVEAPDRSSADREIDAGRHPGELLAFAAIAPGMRVAEIGAGGGYTTELLARAVGPTGTVYSENTKFIVDHFAAKPWGERLAKPALKNVVRVVRDLDDPLPADAKGLDAVFVVLVYHDTVWMGADRDKLNRAAFAALRPGGELIVVDHSAKDGTGLSDVKTLHRIDEHAVIDEVERAGFHLAAEANFLRNASDARDWNDSPKAAAERRGKSDRFVLKFVK